MNELFEIEPCHALPCACQVFNVKGQSADTYDFGNGGDDSPEDAEDYACGNWQFHAKPPTDEVLRKYGITLDEYSQIATALEDKLAVGSCGWCI